MENAIPTRANWKELWQARRKIFPVRTCQQHKDRTNTFKNQALKAYKYFSVINTLLSSSHRVFKAFRPSQSMKFVNLPHKSTTGDALDLEKV